MADSEPVVRVEREGDVAIVTLNRPDKLNSVNAAVQQALPAAIDQARDARCLVLTGAGRGFCAGQDLTERTGDTDTLDTGRAIEGFYNPLVRQIRGLAMPVIAAVNGVAAGAGANIALACDIVLAARSAKFIQAFAKIGLIPDSGGTFFLPRLVGPARAMGLALLAEPLPAEQAADWGLIWRAVDDDRLMPEARALAQHLAAQPTAGLALIKRAIQAGATNDLDAQLDLERDLQREAGRTADYREGVAAFLAKRPARFTGR